MSRRLWLLPNLLSLDAPAIAVLWQGFFAALFHIPLTMAGRVSLGLTVWAIYIADRLLDIHTSVEESGTARHQFHRRHRKAMSWLLLAVVACALPIALFQVRPIVLYTGAVLASAVLAYLYSVHRGYLSVSKEFVVAVLFSLGTILVPLARADRKEPILVAGAAFFVACLANTILIETVESPRSSRASRPVRAGRWLLPPLGLACLYSDPGARLAVIAAASSTLALVMLYRRRKGMSSDAFRVLADAALLSPIPVWLVWQI